MAAHVTLVVSTQPLPLDAISPLAKHVGLDAYTVKLALNRPRPVVLGQPVDDAAAEQAVRVLTEHGCEAYAIDAEQLKTMPEPVRTRTLEFHRDHLRFIVSDAETRLAPWDNLFLLVHGRCRLNTHERTVTRRSSAVRSMPTYDIDDSSTAGMSEKLDFYFYDGSEPMRIDADRFGFLFLGSRKGLTDAENVATTIKMIRKLAPNVLLDEGFEEFRRAAGTLGATRSLTTAANAGGVESEKRIDDDAPRFNFYSRLSFLIRLRRAQQDD